MIAFRCSADGITWGNKMDMSVNNSFIPWPAVSGLNGAGRPVHVSPRDLSMKEPACAERSEAQASKQ